MGPVEALQRAAAIGLMPPGDSILLAVSGGADSMALLYAAAEAAHAHRWNLAVGHVHHGWRRRDADRDLAFVSEHARRLGLPFLARRRDARAEARRRKLSPEAAARMVRYEALAEMASEANACRIATAHQRDDRIESYLLARSRRCGSASLAGPRERRDDRIVRPMLGVSRTEVLDFLATRGISHRRDRTNGDLMFPRNRVRRALALLAASASGRQTIERLARRVERLDGERRRLDSEFERIIRPRLAAAPGCVVTDAAMLASCETALARLAVEEAARPFARPGRPPLTGREREQILAKIASGLDFRFEAGRRIRFERRGAILRVVGPRQESEPAGRTPAFPVSSSPASYYHSPITPQRP